jgi:uncharacterized protein (TIGR02145 family)
MGGGSRWDNNGLFYNLNDLGYFWTSSMSSEQDGILIRLVSASRTDIFRDYNPAYKGYSVRCIKN